MRGAQAVGAGVTAADDDDVLAGRDDRRDLEVAFLNPVRGLQVLHREVDAVELAAGRRQVAARGRTHGEHDRVVRVAQLLDGQSTPTLQLVTNAVPSASICSSRRSSTRFSILNSGIP